MFINNKKVDRVIIPDEAYALAQSIENFWVATKPNSIPTSKSIYNIRDLND